MVKKTDIIEDKPFKGPVEIELKNGEKVILPRLTLGKIVAVTDSMNTLISIAQEKTPQLFDVISGKSGDNAGSQIIQMLPTILPYLISELIIVISAYLGKEEDWVKDNMDMEDLVAVATPFFGDILVQGKHLIAPVTEALKKVN